VRSRRSEPVMAVKTFVPQPFFLSSRESNRSEKYTGLPDLPRFSLPKIIETLRLI